MPRRLFKQVSRQRHRWQSKWFMKPFASVLGDPALWSINRRNVTRALALGLFIAFIPLPAHVLLAALMAIALRVNLPVTLTAVFITNPLTVVPLYMAAYWVGAQLMDINMQPRAASESLQAFWHGPFWQPFLLGCLVLGLTIAMLGYVLLGVFWHTSLVRKYYQRKRERKNKNDEATDGRE